MYKPLHKRILSLLLILALLSGSAVPVLASPAEENYGTALSFEELDTNAPSVAFAHQAEAAEDVPEYADDEVVRVSIILQEASTLEKGFSTAGIASNVEASSYRSGLVESQAEVTAAIESVLGTRLDVVWNLTLAANLISANVAYGQIDTIEALPQVEQVVLESRYEPCVVQQENTAEPSSATSGVMIGSAGAYAAGYTGAGTRVAIIDTGLDMDHEAFNAAGFDYALSRLAQQEDKTLEEYQKELDLLDPEEIEKLLPQLNAYERSGNATGLSLYKSSKVAFGYNYIDNSVTYVDHDQDAMGGHGSHVTGIAAGNSYVPDGEGGFKSALTTTAFQGVAPDAQILVMKVFGMGGGAYDSDYMAAIEDALILGCDSVNLSLSSTSAGFGRSTIYGEIMDMLVGSDTVVTISASNSGHWADYARHNAPGRLYAEDVSTHTGGAPGSYTNSLGIASVDNDGATGYYVTVGEHIIFYNEYTPEDYGMDRLNTLGGQWEYIFLDSIGTEEEFAAIGAEVLTGKVAICSRGTTSFYQKAEAAVKYGAIATIIYNNQPGVSNMNMTGYTKPNPCVSITQQEGALVKAASTPVTDDSGNVLYYTGTITIEGSLGSAMFNSPYYTMSSFSSWGAPGTLEMKPEITAPGGSIYSVDGDVAGGTSYITMSGTSMAAPQVAGMAALLGQYIQENGLDEKYGLTQRALTQSLLMSTAIPMEMSEGIYYPVLQQGAGLANVGNAVGANSFLTMGADATDSWADGKVKVELKDDPEREGIYEFGFTLQNIRDEAQEYMLYADLFTQALISDGTYQYMDTSTAGLMANVTWTVNGMRITPAGDITVYDFNGDGLVNSQDVQRLLDRAVGQNVELFNSHLADMNADGSLTTYDAWLLLDMLNTGLLTLEPGAKAEIRVKVALTVEQKAELNANYPNGAYLEGFIYAEQLATEEGLAGTCHSIPLLGFYGNWSDPSMFDQGTLIDRLYGNTKPSYTGQTNTNALTIKYPGMEDAYYFTGNPYGLEETYPAGKEAINPNTTLYKMNVTKIRNAASAAIVVTDQEGEYLYIGRPETQSFGAYYYINGRAWYNTLQSVSINKTAADMGAEDGDVITVSYVAIPELYEVDGALQEEQIKELLNKGTLGKGAFLSQSFIVDSQAPRMLGGYLDPATGNVLIHGVDDQYIATVQIMDEYGMVYGSAVGDQDAAGEESYTLVELTEDTSMLGDTCVVLLGDYAGNQATYTMAYATGGSDKLIFYAYGNQNYRGTGKRWMSVDPENLWYYDAQNYSGTRNLVEIDYDITAAEYVDGYVFMAGTDGNLYVSPHSKWDEPILVGRYADTAATIVDLAFNYKNATMYALTPDGKVYSVDTSTGKLELVVSFASTNAYPIESKGMTIDDEGNFYMVGVKQFASPFVQRFTLEDVVDGSLTVQFSGKNHLGWLGIYPYWGANLAWDHDNDALYMFSSQGRYGGANIMAEISLTNGQATKVTANSGGYGETYASSIYLDANGLYTVPKTLSGGNLKPATEATAITLNKTRTEGIVGGTLTLQANVTPWNLEDKSVIWESSDETVATVKNGVVTILREGTAVITATTNAAPGLTASCTVNGRILDIDVTGLVTDAQGNAYWADFNSGAPADWEKVSDKAEAWYGGGMAGGMIYTHDGANIYATDPDTFEVTKIGGIPWNACWSDAAEFPALEGTYSEGFVNIGDGGYTINYVSTETWTMTYHPMVVEFGENPMAAIAYFDTAMDGNGHNCNWYYAVTERGDLYRLYFYKDGAWDYTNYKNLGNLGIKMEGVSDIYEGQHASMIYDEASGYLLLAVSVSGNSSELYAIDPVNVEATLLGQFGDRVFPVTTMYQYDRVTELSVRLNQIEADLYEEETLKLKARVLPVTYEDGVTWTSSNEAVAKVDSNGLITAVSEGTAVITATSIATDENGNNASNSCTVNVKGLVEVNATFNAVTVSSSGNNWITYNTGTKTATVNASADVGNMVNLTNGGAHDGKLYASASNYPFGAVLYQIDPSNSFKAVAGPNASGDYAFGDMSTAPATTATFTTSTGETVEMNTFGFPLYVTYSGWLVGLTDFTTGSIFGWDLSKNELGLGGFTYAGDVKYTNIANETVDAKEYYALSKDGTLYRFDIWAHLNAEDQLTYSLEYTNMGNVGVTFNNPELMSMTLINQVDAKGLMLNYNNETYFRAELYFIDLTAETLTCGRVGTIDGVTAMGCLYTDEELTGQVKSLSADLPELEENTVVGVQGGYLFAQQTQTMVACSLGDVTTNAAEAQVTTADLQPASDAKPGQGEETARLAITAKDSAGTDAASTNGVVTVKYDKDRLNLDRVESNAEFLSVIRDEANGQLTIGYVNGAPIAAGDPVATVIFTVKEVAETTLTVEHQELEDTAPNYTETVALTYDHANTELRNVVEAACVTEGYSGDVYCADCGLLLEKGQTIPATGHSYEAVVTAPTCTEAGYTTYTCTVCGDTYTDDEVPATGHDYETVVTEPTCTERGYTTYTCTVCGDTYTDDYVSATGHTFGDWTVTRKATCTEDGEETRICACGETETRTVEKLGHTYELVTVEPTCTKAGYTMNVCSVCDDNYIVEVLDPTGHDYEAVVTEPTCTEQGYTTYTCAACGDSYTDDYTDALGHTFGQWVLTRQETCTEAGTETRTCEVCGETETRETAIYCPAEDFTDVDTRQWYHKGICYVLRNGLMNGKGEGIFAPNADLTRAELVTVLYRMAGSPSTDGLEHPFTDVAEGTWYTDAVTWAYNAEVVKGMTDTTFAPAANTTREQIATILFRYAEAEAVEENALADFTDAAKVSDWAAEAMNWAVSVGLINGMDETTLAPQGNATRAQIATILMRYCEGCAKSFPLTSL